MTFREILDKLQETHRQTKGRSTIFSAFPARSRAISEIPVSPLSFRPVSHPALPLQELVAPVSSESCLQLGEAALVCGSRHLVRLCLSLYFIVQDTPRGGLSPRKCSWGWLGAALERLSCLPQARGRESSALLGSEPRDPPCARPALGRCLASFPVLGTFLPASGAPAVSARCNSLFVLRVGRTDFGRQVVHETTSLRAPMGSSGDLLLPFQRWSPRLGAATRQGGTCTPCFLRDADCSLLEDSGHMWTGSFHG